MLFRSYAVGHDEDGDGRDDGCDNCPTYDNAWQLDDDMDGDGYGVPGTGLGNECEAPFDEGMLSGYSVFDAMTSPSNAWTTSDDTEWTWGADELVGSSPSDGANMYHSTQHGSGPYSVETVFDIVPDVTNQNEKYSCVLFAVQSSSSNGTFWECCYEWDSRALSVWRFNGYWIELVGEVDDVDTSSPDASIWRRVRVYHDGGDQLVCTFENETDEVGTSATYTVPTNQLPDDLGGHGGLRVYNSTTAFRSYMIYTD
mgnify:CR=1 FL=1